MADKTEKKSVLSDSEKNENSSDENQISLCQKTLDDIENLYAEFNVNSKTDRVLSRYDSHFKFLYESFHKVLKNEADLYNNLLVLKREFNDLNMKYSQALKLSKIDEQTKNDLLNEIEKAWYQASYAKNKEKRGLETVNSLKLEIFNLSKLVEQGVGLTMGQEYNLREIIKEKENLMSENKKLIEEIEEIKKEIEILKQKDDKYNKIVEESKVQVSHANQEVLGCKLEIQKLSRKNEQLEKEIANEKRINESKEISFVRSTQTIQSLKDELSKSDQTIKELQFSLEKYKKEIEIQNGRYQKLENELSDLLNKYELLEIDYAQLDRKAKKNDEIIKNQKFENIQTQKMRDAFERKIKMIEDQMKEISSEKQIVELQSESLKKVNENLEKEKDSIKKHLNNLILEKDSLYLNLKKFDDEILTYKDKIKILKNEIKNLTNENINLKIESENLAKTIKNFDKERLKFSESMNEMHIKKNKLNEELKLKDLLINDSKNKYLELETKFKDLKLLYENTRTDKNIYSKNLLKSKDEINEIKLKIESHENVQFNLKKSLEKKSSDLSRLKNDNIEFKKNSFKLIAKLDKNQTFIENVKSKIDFYKINEDNFLKIITDMQNDFDILSKDFSKLTLEKSILGSQLVRRNDEISLLYEKIRVLEGIIKRGDICYKKISEDLKRTFLELNTIKKQNDLLRANMKQVKNLQKELVLSERDLIIEKAKRNAIENQQNSVNVHRWRKLKIADPNNYELILKVNILQKKLIFKSEQLVHMQLKFIEKDQLFLELKKWFSRRISTENNSEEIQKYKIILSKTSRQLKLFLAENEMLTKLNDKQKIELNNKEMQLKELKMINLNTKSNLFRKINKKLQN